MNKKVILPLVFVLFFVTFLAIFLPILINKNNKQSSFNPVNQNKATTINTGTNQTKNSQIIVDNSDVKIIYSPENNKYTTIKKTPQADQRIDTWLSQNNLSKNSPNVDIVDATQMAGNPEISQTNNNPNLSIYPTVDPNLTPIANNNTDSLIDILNQILLSKNTDSPSTTITPTTALSGLTITPKNKKKTPTPTQKSGAPAGEYVYYAQCGGSFDNYPLPSGCTVCEAGCGPTSVSMIVASYVDKNVTPKTIVDLYKQKGYFLGCDGSRYTDAKLALGSYGLKTTDYLTYSLATIDQAGKDFKNYIDGGWTIFVLANYCDPPNSCGHFFWITDMGANNETWAYDPYYGKGQTPPYNEKSRYPFPKYRVAFGVKK